LGNSWLRKPVDFSGLVEALRSYWKMLADKYLRIEDITIIGIDLADRFK
jgi:hypothetical protein